MLFLASNNRQMGFLAKGVYTPATGPFGGHSTLTTNLKAYWKFDDDATDELGSYDGTEQNSPTYATGIINNGIDLETSSSQYVSVDPGLVDSDTGAGSVSLWFKAESATDSNFFAFGGGAGNELCGLQYVSSKVRYIWRGATTGSIVLLDNAGGTTINTGTWYHFVVTTDGSTLKIYVNTSDETNVDTGSNNGNWFGDTSPTGTTQLNIGRRYWGGSAGGYFDGIIDEMGYWDKELSSAEVSDLYNSGSGLSY